MLSANIIMMLKLNILGRQTAIFPDLSSFLTYNRILKKKRAIHIKLIELLGIPEGYIPFGTTVIGYPAEQYYRVPLRKVVDFIFREKPDYGITALRMCCAPGDLYCELKDS
jgi:hypothetical protein